MKNEWWKSNGGKASALFLIVALAVEMLSVIKVNILSGKIIAALNDEAAQAVKRAGELGVSVDTVTTFVRGKTDELDKAVASLNVATARVADRDLTPNQILRIGKELRPFAGRKILVGSYRGDNEGARLAKKVETAMVGAGMEVIDKAGLTLEEYHGVEFGIAIVGSGFDKELTDALAKILRTVGHLEITNVGEKPVLFDGAIPTVGIMVCIKPSTNPK